MAPSGDRRTLKTLELVVSANYWWPQMSRYIGQYVRRVISAFGLRFSGIVRLESFIRSPFGEPLGCISVDFIGELPDSMDMMQS